MNQKIVDFLTLTAKEKGITYETLAERIHLSKSTISRIFTGKQDPSMDQLHSIVEVGLEAKMSDLYAEVGEQEMRAAENDGYKGYDALREDYEQREQRIREHCKALVESAERSRDESIRALTDRNHRLEENHAQEINRLQAMHDKVILTQAESIKETMRRQDEAYQRSVSYLKGQIEIIQSNHVRELEALIAQHERERSDDENHFENERAALHESIQQLTTENKRLRRWNFWIAISLAVETVAVLGILIYDMLNHSVGWFRSLMMEHGGWADRELRG